MQPIEIHNLSKVFRGKKGRRVEALKDLTLTVGEGEVFGFLGPNGAGKSTTIKTLVGLITPTTGQARLLGRPVTDAAARQAVGYLPENPAFYDYLTAHEYLRLVGCTFGMDSGRIVRESNRVLELMSLADAANRSIRGYSKGMVQRLGLAQTLLHDPDLYILDEPMSGLDPVGRALVKQIILDLRQRGKTVFFSTHVIADVEAVCDRVGIIVDGRLEFVRSVGEILRSGIEGYTLQVCGIPRDFFPEGMTVSSLADGRFVVNVPKEEYQEFMQMIFTRGGQIEAIEPRRKSLETLFLEIIKKKS